MFQSASPVGNFTFNTQLTDNGAGSGGNAIASFLLGYPSQVARSHSLIYPHYHTNEPNVFVQDDWRATSWLTLNLGVRYDVFTPLTEEDNQLANFDPATGKDSGRGTERRERRARTSRPTTPTSRRGSASPPRCRRASSSAAATGWRTSPATCSRGRS